MILSVVLALNFFPIQGYALEGKTSECISIEEMNRRHNEACELLNEIKTLQLNKSRQMNEGIATASIDDDIRLEEIRNELIDLGVREVSYEELGISSMARSVTIPSTQNESWYIAEYITAFQGIQYQVIDLIAQASWEESKLMEIGNGVTHTATGLVAGSSNYFEIAVVSAILGT